MSNAWQRCCWLVGKDHMSYDGDTMHGPDSIKHGQGDIRRMNRPQVVIKVCSEDTNFPQPACACLTLHLLKSASDEQLATTKQPIKHRWSVVSYQLLGFRHNHRSQYAQEELALVRWSRSRWTKGLEPCWVPTFSLRTMIVCKKSYLWWKDSY